MEIAPHMEWFTIRGYEVDADNRLTIQSLCNYYQEAAGIHAAALGLSIEKLHSEGVTWVLFRMQMEIGRLPAAMERVVVETWPVGVEGLQYRRDFLARDDRGEIVGKAVTHWVVVSLESRRVVRVPQCISDVRLEFPRTVMPASDVKLQPLDDEDTVCRFRARLGDMDRNRHVNNVRYLDWILECVPENVRREKTLSSMDICYKAESRQGDRISARIRAAAALPDEADSLKFIHCLALQEDNKEVARARSVWQARG